jgi:hypothetical protein
MPREPSKSASRWRSAPLRLLERSAELLPDHAAAAATARRDRDHAVQLRPPAHVQCERAALAVADDEEVGRAFGAQRVQRGEHLLFRGGGVHVVVACAGPGHVEVGDAHARALERGGEGRDGG